MFGAELLSVSGGAKQEPQLVGRIGDEPDASWSFL